MGILNLFKNQLSKIIQWEDQDPSLLWYRFENERNEIINASKLIVAPGQGCILVYQGKIADVIEQEGTYNLETDNHPFITTLLKIRQNFESEHKLYAFFYLKTEITNQSWGTASPIKYLDGVYNIPVEMGANGNFSYHISNPSFLFSNIIGNLEQYSKEQMRTLIGNRIPQAISSYLATQKYSFQEIDAQLPSIAAGVIALINPEFEKIGLQLSDFKITGTIFDEKTIARIGRVADVTTDTMAARVAGLNYVDLEKLRALRDAARNEGGLAGVGAQMGVGMELGRQFNDEKDRLLNNNGDDDTVKKLQKLKILLDEDIITAAEFDELKKQLLTNLK